MSNGMALNREAHLWIKLFKRTDQVTEQVGIKRLIRKSSELPTAHTECLNGGVPSETK
jgi:hypothetical protein